MDLEIKRRFLGRIHSEARRMLRLSETLLKLARTGADLGDPELRPMGMGFLKEVAERAEPLAEGAGLELFVDDRGGLVLADPEWLEQALLILMSNAVKHSGRGNRVWMRVDGGAFEVEDPGRAFERHYRGGAPRAPGASGLGCRSARSSSRRWGARSRSSPWRGWGPPRG